MRSKELRSLQSQQPEEKKAKYKPLRQDFSLELLCGNNQFDNILIESNQVLTDLLTYITMAKETKLIMKSKNTYFITSSGNEMKFTLKKKTSEGRTGIFKSVLGSENKLLLKRVVQEKATLDEPVALPQSPKRSAEPKGEEEITETEEGLSPRSILKGISQYDNATEVIKEKVKSPKKVTPVKKFKVSKVTWGTTPTPPKKKKKKLKLPESIIPGIKDETAPRVKRKYTKRKNMEGTNSTESSELQAPGNSNEEVPRVKRKYTKRNKVEVPDKPDALPIPSGPSNPKPSLPEDSEILINKSPGSPPTDTRVKRKYIKRKKPEDDTEGEENPKVAKKRGRPKVIKSPPQPSEFDPENQSVDMELKRPRKGRPKKLTDLDVAKCQNLDIQLITENKLTGLKETVVDISDKPATVTSKEGFKEWSTEVMENVSKGVFDFEDNDDSTASYLAHSLQPKCKMDEGSLNVKQIDALNYSGDEQQVPLKITFKRPKQTEEEISSNQPRKSIKLRVKTQTTKDHGLKIQIRQPKTDNPLKFKVKTTKSKKIKKIDPSISTTASIPTCTTTSISVEASLVPKTPPASTQRLPSLQSAITASQTTPHTPVSLSLTGMEPLLRSEVKSEVRTGTKIKTEPPQEAQAKPEQKEMQDLLTPPEPKIQPEQVVKPVIEVGVQAITEPAAVKQDKIITKKNLEDDTEPCSETTCRNDLSANETSEPEKKPKVQVVSEPGKEKNALIQKNSGLAQICSVSSDVKDKDPKSQEFAVHPGLRPNNVPQSPSKVIAEETSTQVVDTNVLAIQENRIGQLDGWDDLEDLTEDEDTFITQLDGSYDGFYKASPGQVTKCQGATSKSVVLVVDSGHMSNSTTTTTTGQSSNSTGNNTTGGTPTASNTTNTTTGPAQIKRDRSVSDDGQEDGDNPTKKKHQCHICNKLFPNSFRLKTHVRVHTGEKPFKCEPCAQAFADRSNYVKHKQTKTHRNKVEGAVGLASSGGSVLLGSQELRFPAPAGTSRSVISTYGEAAPQEFDMGTFNVKTELDNSREVPQFDFLDSPGTPFNQHDLDSHVPIDGYDTDDSLPMTFEDMDDVSLATEQYMFSSQLDGVCDSEEEDKGFFAMFNFQLDGEQDGTLGQIPGVQLLVNGNTASSEGSILARHLGLVVTKAPGRSESPELTFSCDMCSAKLKNKRNFETHMKRHRGELPFKCEECPKTFQGRRDLETHKRSRHDTVRKGVVVDREETDMDMGHPVLLSPVLPSNRQKTIVLNMNSLPSGLLHNHMNTVLIKQDPVMVANHKDEPPDPDTDFILQDSLPLFDNSLMESSDSAVNLSLDDLTSFAQPLGGSLSSSGLHQDNSFDASMDGSASFLSGADMSTDTFELVGEEEGEVTPYNSSHGQY